MDEGFLDEYKALIAAVLAPSRKFEDYYRGGRDLYRKSKLLSEISEMGTVGEIVARLRKELGALESRLAKDSILVGKSKYRGRTIAMAVALVLFAAVAALSAKYAVLDIPEMRTSIDVSGRFLASDYIGLLEAVMDKELSSFTKEERYMAAYAGVATSSMGTAQHDAVMKQIMLSTDSLFLDFWVEMGRGNYESAVDVAQRIGNSEMELYGLLIWKDAAEADTHMAGSEKTELLDSLDGRVKALQEKTAASEEEGAESPADGTMDGEGAADGATDGEGAAGDVGETEAGTPEDGAQAGGGQANA
jgi:uncharacterized membrane protein YukC